MCVFVYVRRPRVSRSICAHLTAHACMPYVYALCVCLMCMPYVYALYTRLGCMACYMSYMHAANAGAARAVLFRVRVCVYVYM